MVMENSGAGQYVDADDMSRFGMRGSPLEMAESSIDNPERPGSAPPMLDLTSKSLFAFGSEQSNFFSPGYMRTGDLDLELENRPDIENVSRTKKSPSLPIPNVAEPVPMGNLYASGAQNRRKNSIEMFLSQSPSHSLGEEFMKFSLGEDDDVALDALQGFKPSGTGENGPSGDGRDGRVVSSGIAGRTRNGGHYETKTVESFGHHMMAREHNSRSFETSSPLEYPNPADVTETRSREPDVNTGSTNIPYYVPAFDGSGIPITYANSYPGLVPGVGMSHAITSQVAHSSNAYTGLIPSHVMMSGMVPVQWALPVMQNGQHGVPHSMIAGYSPSPHGVNGPHAGAYGAMGPMLSPGTMKHIGKPSSVPRGGKFKYPENKTYGIRTDGMLASPLESEERRTSPTDKGSRADARKRKGEKAVSPSHRDQSVAAEMKPEDIVHKVFQMSKDQNGCRLLQELLDQMRPDMRDIIFEESLEHLSEMMVDPFGNYLFQKLVEMTTNDQRTQIVERVSGNLVAAALNLHGTRSVQKVVETCRQPEQVKFIVDALRKQAVRLCIDSNGNHVIQRALQNMHPDDNNFVFDAVAGACVVVGTHRHGCCVLQRCLDAANVEQKKLIIEQVEENAMHLMQDPYGNYVVQYVLDTCSSEEARGVIMKPLGHVAHLSEQKFSSNVIEKCLEKAPEDVREAYLDEISSKETIKHLLQDQYANYVVQRALSVASYTQGMILVNAIKKHLPAMRNTSGGRRIAARIMKRFPNVDLEVGPLSDE